MSGMTGPAVDIAVVYNKAGGKEVSGKQFGHWTLLSAWACCKEVVGLGNGREFS